MPVSELLHRYKADKLPLRVENTRKTYRTSLAAIETYFVKEGGDPRAGDVHGGQVEGFMTWRRLHSPDGSPRARPLSARSVAKDRMVLHILFSFAQRLRVVEANPVTNEKAEKGDTREPFPLGQDQYEALVAACEGRPMLETYVLVLGEAGLRCDSEALWLRWKDIDLETGLLTVESVRGGRRNKSGKTRMVPITQRLRAALRNHMATFRLRTYGGQRSPWVFHHEIDRRHAKAGERIGSLRRAFAGATKRAGIPSDLNQHDLRHRRVTEWLRQGHSPHKVQRAMGHSDIRTTMAYSHLVAEDLLTLVEPDRPPYRSVSNSS